MNTGPLYSVTMETIKGYYKQLTANRLGEQRKTLNETRKREFAGALEERARRKKIKAEKVAKRAAKRRHIERKRRAEVNRQLNEIVDLCIQCVDRAVSKGRDRARVSLAIGDLWDEDWIELVKRLKSRGYRVKNTKGYAVDRYYVLDGEIHENNTPTTIFESHHGPIKRPLKYRGWIFDSEWHTFCYKYTISV
jgi:hypothetical protein